MIAALELSLLDLKAAFRSESCFKCLSKSNSVFSLMFTAEQSWAMSNYGRRISACDLRSDPNKGRISRMSNSGSFGCTALCYLFWFAAQIYTQAAKWGRGSFHIEMVCAPFLFPPTKEEGIADHTNTQAGKPAAASLPNRAFCVVTYEHTIVPQFLLWTFYKSCYIFTIVCSS